MQANNEKTLTRETEICMGQVLVLFHHYHFLSPNSGYTQLIVTRTIPPMALPWLPTSASWVILRVFESNRKSTGSIE
jgi:hypothetical protein